MVERVVLTTFKLRRDTAANWTAENPVLAAGEPGWETGTGKMKVGDGVTAWNALAYLKAGSVEFADIEGDPTDNVALVSWGASLVDGVVGGAPAGLDTLDEIAAAIGDDTDFAGTMTAALAAKAPLASPALTGNPTAPTQSTGDDSTKIATTEYVNDEIAAQFSDENSWTSTITAQTGTITSTTQTARYMRIGKLVIFTILITITDAGTGAGNLYFTLPVDAAYNTAFAGRNNQVVALYAFCSASSSQVSVRRYDNTTTIATGRVIVVSGSYFTA